MTISSIQDIVADIKAGKMVILVDEEDRENEGDLVLAADFVSAEAIRAALRNWMSRFSSAAADLPLSHKCVNGWALEAGRPSWSVR